ncbi:hypothetical protein [Paraburkholderia bannensis]|uniref:hypothetical protein n=1 Tax=Paraburkholderia bannensis TaxID=765414 RepID=UPI002ABD3271|nr:hypothetical protein [Paraburkholderia bannensis]
MKRFGVRLSVPQLAQLLSMAEGTVRNQISAEIFPIPTCKEGSARFAPYEAVAEYRDRMSEQARQKAA